MLLLPYSVSLNLGFFFLQPYSRCWLRIKISLDSNKYGMSQLDDLKGPWDCAAALLFVLLWGSITLLTVFSYWQWIWCCCTAWHLVLSSWNTMHLVLHSVTYERVWLFLLSIWLQGQLVSMLLIWQELLGVICVANATCEQYYNSKGNCFYSWHIISF